MSLTPFVYVDTPLFACAVGDTVTVSADTAKHLTTVLRLKPGAAVVVSDGAGVCADATVTTTTTLTLTRQLVTDAARMPEVTLVQGAPKLRKLDTVVRLAAEGDVTRVLPVVTARSQSSLDDLTQEKLVLRLDAIATAAGEQARRANRLDVANAIRFVALTDVLDGTPLLLFDHSGQMLSAGVAQLKPAIDRCGQVAVFVGPEGGFTAEERDAAIAAGAVVVRLSATVLRSEHAGLAAVAAVSALLGRYDT